MSQLKLCLHTQTPYLRFLDENAPPGWAPALSELAEGVDYEKSPGGVTRMMHGLLHRLLAKGRLRDATWMSLARGGPSRYALAPRLGVEHVQLAAKTLIPYAAAKGALWDEVHGTLGRPALPEHRVARGLEALSIAMARRALALHKEEPFDVFYVHDFQLTPLAQFLPAGVPRVFRWHIPVPETPTPLLAGAVKGLNRYDAVIVSTQAYAARLQALGVTVPIHPLYPYVDESRKRVVTAEDVHAFNARWGLDPGDPVFLLVARLDPIKSQDVALRAMARLAAVAPRARLLVVGGGGFSGDRKAGLGMVAFSDWEASLRDLARRLGIERSVVFTGNLPDGELDVAYTRARALLLPSRLEGFGLTAIEGWLYGRPVVVSRGAGVSELVREGRNGFTHAPGDEEVLADHLLFLAENPEVARHLGREGRATAQACHLGPGTEAVWRVLEGAVRGAERARGPVGLPRREPL
ncbi:MAG TPA: glycosyltransferase family 4 protein [Candidatus Thermoplasmatota archaeon]|nr:glycosyltransferase family 4 protein [Candidatus Thermoplasmatota archaeon]